MITRKYKITYGAHNGIGFVGGEEIWKAETITEAIEKFVEDSKYDNPDIIHQIIKVELN